MGGIPAARYREQVMSESHEATEAGDSKDPSSDLYPFRTPNRGMSLVSSCPPTTTHVWRLPAWVLWRVNSVA